MFGNLTLNVIYGWRGTQVCLYFEGTEHCHTIPGLDLYVLMSGGGREKWAIRY